MKELFKTIEFFPDRAREKFTWPLHGKAMDFLQEGVFASGSVPAGVTAA